MRATSLKAVVLVMLFGLYGCASSPETGDGITEGNAAAGEFASASGSIAEPEGASGLMSSRPIGAGGSISTGVREFDPSALAIDSSGPLDLEAEEYLVGPQDLLTVRVFGVDALSGDVRVSSGGDISIPLVGTVRAAGLTPVALEKRLADLLAINYLQDPQVSVFVKEYGSQRITIEGAIGRPGVYALSSRTTLLQSIALAGGLARLADSSSIRLMRPVNNQGDFETLIFDLDKIRNGAINDPVLAGGDKIVVLRNESRVMLNDSLFRDTIDLLNPFRYVTP